MKKIPTLFVRDENDRRYLTSEVTPGCEWVINGEGVPTRKYDGTCVMLDDNGKWWARREVKPGKSAPADFIAEETDTTTGKTVGWEPVEQSGYAKIHDEAVKNTFTSTPAPGTFELCGPKVQGNPEHLDENILIRHASAERCDPTPRDFDGLREWLSKVDIEGLVWHHPDGRMAKLKRRDFPKVEQ